MDTRRRILDRAIACIREEGVDSLSGRRICSDLKINISSIKYHFGDKRTLIRLALQELSNDLSPLSGILMDRTLPLEDRIVIFITSLWDEIVGNPDVIRYVLTAKHSYPTEPDTVLSNPLLLQMKEELALSGLRYSVLDIRMKMLQIISSLAYPAESDLFSGFTDSDRKKYIELLSEMILPRSGTACKGDTE